MSTRKDELLKAFQIVDSQATADVLATACADLFMRSDEYHCSSKPFSPSDIEAVAHAICEYVLNPRTEASREIVRDAERPLQGKWINCDQYAEMFSEDMVYQNFSSDFASRTTEDLRRDLKAFLAALFFRYTYCTITVEVMFPISIILEYSYALRTLLLKEQREHELPDALLTTLQALRAIESTADDHKEFFDRMSEKWMKRARG